MSSIATAVLPVIEGEAPFDHPPAGKPLKTWYKVTGELNPNSIPLIILHGGPGVGSEAYNALTDLVRSHSIPVIQYDQVGCKRSTHLSEKATSGAEFWNDSLFIAELYSLVHHLGLDRDGRQYDILGHSWGGMFGTTFAATQPKGLRKYVIMSSAASIPLWLEAQNRLLKTLPEDVQETVRRCEKEGKTDSDEYQGAMMEYYSRFMCRLDPVPDEIMDGLAELSRDPTVYGAMWGASEFFISGTLKDWSSLDIISKIRIPVLLTNGRYDEAQDSCMLPFFEKLHKVKWVQFSNSAHMAQYEERERFVQVVGDFLKDSA